MGNIVALSAARLHRSDSAILANVLNALLKPFCGRAAIISTKAQSGSEWLSRREALRAELAAMKPTDPRRGKLFKRLSLVTHEALRK